MLFVIHISTTNPNLKKPPTVGWEAVRLVAGIRIRNLIKFGVRVCPPGLPGSYSNHKSALDVDIALAPADNALITSSFVSISPPAITGMSVLSAKYVI